MPQRKVAAAVRQAGEKVLGKKRMKALEVDHIQPLAEGGKDTLKNLQVIGEGAHKVKTKAEAVARSKRRRKG